MLLDIQYAGRHAGHGRNTFFCDVVHRSQGWAVSIPWSIEKNLYMLLGGIIPKARLYAWVALVTPRFNNDG